MFFDVLVIRKKVFTKFSHYIETYIDVIIEVFKVKSSVAFEFSLDEYFI